jgi:hypothetical protein
MSVGTVGPTPEQRTMPELVAPSSIYREGSQVDSGRPTETSRFHWTFELPAASQLSVLFKFNGDKIYEERWFVDTEQWKSAF